MPIYEYYCEKCGVSKETTHGMSENPSVKCPKCGKKMKRAISRNSFQLKGTGWYKTDYAKPGKKEGSSKDS